MFILAASVAALILSVGVGSVTVSPDRIITVIADHLLPWTIPTSATDIETRIIWEFRLPRALLGFVVGAALAVAGAVLQAVVRNPLADPFVFGVSSGTSVAAVATLTLATGALAVVSVPIAAFAGALATTLIVFLLAQQRGRVTPRTGSCSRALRCPIC